MHMKMNMGKDEDESVGEDSYTVERYTVKIVLGRFRCI